LTCVTHKQTETSEKRRAERAEAFVAPVERAATTVEEKRKRKLREVEREMDNKDGRKRKKKGIE
jgi:ribosomal RNA assembly protein